MTATQYAGGASETDTILRVLARHASEEAPMTARDVADLGGLDPNRVNARCYQMSQGPAPRLHRRKIDRDAVQRVAYWPINSAGTVRAGTAADVPVAAAAKPVNGKTAKGRAASTPPRRAERAAVPPPPAIPDLAPEDRDDMEDMGHGVAAREGDIAKAINASLANVGKVVAAHNRARAVSRADLTGPLGPVDLSAERVPDIAPEDLLLSLDLLPSGLQEVVIERGADYLVLDEAEQDRLRQLLNIAHQWREPLGGS